MTLREAMIEVVRSGLKVSFYVKRSESTWHDEVKVGRLQQETGDELKLPPYYLYDCGRLSNYREPEEAVDAALKVRSEYPS